MNAATDTLEQSLEADRDHLRETLSAIEDKVSPGRLIDEAMAYFNTGPKEFASLLGAQAKSNPLPILLTGVGLAWLIASERTSDAAPSSSTGGSGTTSGMADDDYDAWTVHDRIAEFELDCSRMPDEPHDDWQTRLHAARASALDLSPNADEDDTGFRARVSSAAETARNRGKAARDRIRDGLKGAKQSAGDVLGDGKAALGHLGEGARSQGQSVVHAAMQLHETNPLVTAAMGVALGALLGSLIPQSDREEAALGSVADKGLDKMASAAHAVSEAVTSKLSTNESPISN